MSEETVFKGHPLSYWKEEAKKLGSSAQESVDKLAAFGIKIQNMPYSHQVHDRPREYSQWVKAALEAKGYTKVDIVFRDALGWEVDSIDSPKVSVCDIYARE